MPSCSSSMITHFSTPPCITHASQQDTINITSTNQPCTLGRLTNQPPANPIRTTKPCSIIVEKRTRPVTVSNRISRIFHIIAFSTFYFTHSAHWHTTVDGRGGAGARQRATPHRSIVEEGTWKYGSTSKTAQGFIQTNETNFPTAYRFCPFAGVDNGWLNPSIVYVLNTITPHWPGNGPQLIRMLRQIDSCLRSSCLGTKHSSGDDDGIFRLLHTLT